MYAFLDNTSLFYSSLFYSCSFVDVVFVDLSDAFDETNSFGVSLLVPSLLGGLLHDVFQTVSVHPVPIEICYGMLSDACLF